MAGRNRGRAVSWGLRMIPGSAIAALVWLAVAAAGQESEPGPFPRIPTTPVADLDRIPPLQFDDEEILPAQFTVPGGPGSSVPSPGRTVPDPPTPVVRIQVRVAADSAPGDDIKYLITIQNTSTADAHGVMVRNPIPDSVEGPVKAEPEWDKARSIPKDNHWKELFWSFGTLPPGKSRTIELTLRPRKDATEVKNLAYVRFDHGEAVTTRIKSPSVKISKFAPKQSVRDESYLVRIAVDNAGRVPAEKIRVTENVPTSAEVVPVTKGGQRMTQPQGQQWVWEIPKLMPGERKIIEYRITARQGSEIYSLTNLSAEKGIHDKAEARTAVLVPGLTVKLTGPAANAPVGPGVAARYEITVRNAGTLPSTAVRVVGTLPADSKPTMKTEGGQVYRDTIQWMIPRLEAGEAQTFRFAVKANSTGRRVAVATVSDARGQRAADEVATLFQGTAALVWESIPNPAALSVGKQGTFTVKVRNNGGEAARNVRLEVELPEAVALVQATPSVKPAGNKLSFSPEEIPAYREAVFTITYEARQSAQAWFKLRMTSDSLGDKPLETQKAVEITGGR